MYLDTTSNFNSTPLNINYAPLSNPSHYGLGDLNYHQPNNLAFLASSLELANQSLTINPITDSQSYEMYRSHMLQPYLQVDLSSNSVGEILLPNAAESMHHANYIPQFNVPLLNPYPPIHPTILAGLLEQLAASTLRLSSGDNGFVTFTANNVFPPAFGYPAGNPYTPIAYPYPLAGSSGRSPFEGFHSYG